MIYVPILKNRSEELRIIAMNKEYLGEKIIPLIEVLHDTYKKEYELDPITGEIIYEERNGKNFKIEKPPTDKNINTLENLNERLTGQKAFIEFFRFSTNKYGTRINLQETKLSWQLNNDEKKLFDRIYSLSKYPNFIPVLSIKTDFVMTPNELEFRINQIQDLNDSFALRITDDFLEKYNDVISTTLRANDYLLLDIEEQETKVKFLEIEEFKILETSAKKVLINSPRKRAINNNNYPECGHANLIDCSAISVVNEHDLHGFGDYCGLKDVLPSSRGGSNGKGCALALLYCYSANKFYSFANYENNGTRGYKEVAKRIQEDSTFFDPENDCPAILRIKQMGPKYGNWCTWINICATRYIHQMFKNIN